MRGITRESSRAVDRHATEVLQIPSMCLMENAGAGSARLVLELGYAESGGVLIVCGTGNNGGDGMVVARHLFVAGFRTELVLLPVPPGRSMAPDAANQLRICRSLEIPTQNLGEEAALQKLETSLCGVDSVVDGLFGTGLDRPVTGLAAEVVQILNASDVPRIALDVPSGLDCDLGTPAGSPTAPCIRAAVTLTFVAPKLGFAVDGSQAYTGDVHVVGIGAPMPPDLA